MSNSIVAFVPCGIEVSYFTRATGGHPEQAPSKSVIGFVPEVWSAPFRNGDPDDFGPAPGLPWHP